MHSQSNLECRNRFRVARRCVEHLQEATKNFLIHSDLTEADKALRFFSVGVVI